MAIELQNFCAMDPELVVIHRQQIRDIIREVMTLMQTLDRLLGGGKNLHHFLQYLPSFNHFFPAVNPVASPLLPDPNFPGPLFPRPRTFDNPIQRFQGPIDFPKDPMN